MPDPTFRALTPVRRSIVSGALLFAGLGVGLAAAHAREALPAERPREVKEMPDDDADVADPVEDRVPRLISEADALAGGGMASAAEVRELTRLMRELKEALEKKTALLETGKPTEEVDALLETAAGALDASSAEIAGRAESGEAVPVPEAPPPRESATAALAGVLEEAAAVLERLKDVRSARSGAEGGETAGAPGSGPVSEPVEEAGAEVTGSVTEEGRPVEGATVVDAETGATATTDADGLFALPGVPAGRVVTLRATKAGRPLGVRRVLLGPGRSALADFGGAASVPGAAGRVRLRPSIMHIRTPAGQATGLILGEVRDARGRPTAGAAVALEHLGVVRSDLRGRFAFLGVPAGFHRVAVRLRGHQPWRQGVRVRAKTRADLRMRLSLAPRRPDGRTGRPVPGARVHLAGPRRERR